MPHGTLRVGEIEVTALCDVVAEAPFPATLGFPDTEEATIRTFPETVAQDGRWRFHDHCFLVRAPGLVVLVDTGVGAEGTVGTQWAGRAGNLPAELAAAGVAAENVDVVVFTHAHFDHIGWAVATGGFTAEPAPPRPTFRNARHFIHRDEVERFPAVGDEGDRAGFEQSIRPLVTAGVLDPFDTDVEIAGTIAVRHAPGHTPGHSVVVVRSGAEEIVLGGDLANHPAQVADPSRRSAADMDPVAAATTRAEWLDRIDADGAYLATAHFAYPFGHVAGGDGGRRWRPADAGQGVD